MKKSEQNRANLIKSKIQAVTRHIRNVEDNCLILGTKLIENGEIDLGHQLIANGFAHDLSKFAGIEFEFLSLNNPIEENNKLKLRLAIQHHQKTNKHHPEAWPYGIKEMPDVYLAEMSSDWKSRSEEFGTNLRQWIDDCAVGKWNFCKNDDVYKKIMKYVDLLCDTPFEEMK